MAATEATPRVALLARAGDACDRISQALSEAGAEVVLVADPLQAAPEEVRQAMPEAILVALDPAIEDAAVVCGASPWEARLRVTLPAISHGLFSAAIFSFLISWDEVVIAIFMASPTLQTLPVRIWGTLRQDLTPVIAAASTLLVALTILLMLAAALLRKGKKA